MSKDEYTAMFDSWLSQELGYVSSAASEHNIKQAMKRVLGISIKNGVIKRYHGLVLDESLNVNFTIVTQKENVEFYIQLIYGK